MIEIEDKDKLLISLVEPDNFSSTIEQELIRKVTGIEQVSICANPLTLLKNLTIHNIKVSIIIAEIDTPKMNGFDLIKNLESLDLLSIPVILMSADESLKDKALEMGAFGFLRKPIYADDLKTMVEQATSMIL